MLSFLLNRYTWIAAAMLVLAVGGFGFGVQWESNRRDAQQLRLERAEREATERLRQEWDASNREISLALARERDKSRTLERNLNERIRYATTSELVNVQSAPQGGTAPVVFTAGFVGLYNSAIARVPETPAGAAGAGAAGGSVSPQDLLANLNANGGEFEACRNQLKAWQDWARASVLAK
jgi:hypothetical protein